ncbi:ATP-dependent RNA helicase HrpA [Thiohalobacter sp. IOR34]|uniref:ATP-dependent RNA helicase HrpA n=1 Tax=Thiohalobacter sp. IOR34 TaxID=3057176 RepID=UPI0025B272C2|nr:ATP-dependent RNA helicase HrpA [Thiohalobacter sp. IOR34]WJW75990.1 ATP-dependent RNA helicase HrpA [Thiohalobacter sp. IOR34]
MSDRDALNEFENRLADCLLRDRPALRRRLAGLRRRLRQGKPVGRGRAALEKDLAASGAECERRRARLPRPEYPQDLPVVQRRADIRAAIEANQVVIVCGETGSGKTTQLPKICLELGRGVAGMIGHTQPRRIAARSLAARIAEELGSEVGAAVGFKVRFSDRVGEGSFVKVMTDGILLAETQGDPELLAYDTLIIDEAHERSLNVDFLLGYLKRLLPRRPDLKLIITSATIDPERFSKHFDDAPIVEVSGRTWPVEIRYRPLRGEDEDERARDRGQALLDAIDELAAEGPGDVLVFLPGERDIREAAELLRKHHPPATRILPLYGRLSAAQQAEVFAPHSGRRIVLATNVAETSLTVPGIRYVVDTGLARISRYSYRTKVQRLPIEPISQASARQRAGRCGRLGPGICIRLYDEDDFNARPAFTDPEILRTNLAAVILQMLSLKLGDIEDFPFVEPPDARFIRDGFKLLHELGAVDAANALTGIGRQLARLPVDVRLGRMILAARDEGCLREVLVIASALAVPDPRERPLDKQQVADEKHRAFAHEQSDFLGFVNLWDFYHEQARHLSKAKLRRLCKQHFLSWLRMRDWHDVHQQLTKLVKDMGFRINQVAADYGAVHRALLTGLLGNIAFKREGHEYLGARGIKLHVFPGSALFKKPPKWIVAAELVETQRQYARTLARIEPEWVERLAGHLVKRSYSDPHWEKRRGQVVAFERTTLYGLVLTPRRKVDFGRIDPVTAREHFILGALVRGEFRARLPFLDHNRRLLEEVETLEAKSRRRDLLVDETHLCQWFDERVPRDICSAAGFERWYRKAGEAERQALRLDREVLMRHEASSVTEAGFPAVLEVQGLRLPLAYHFEPGHADDGVTLRVPLAALNQLDPARLEWLVPGLIEEKVTQLIKSLPKVYRRHFVPAPDFARAALQAMPAGEGSLLEALAAQLARMTGVELPPDAWRPERLPLHLFMNIHLVDSQGRVVARGRDPDHLKREVGAEAAQGFARLPTADFEREDVRCWDFGELPGFIELEQQGVRLRGYPALVVEGERLALRLLDNEGRARAEHRRGLLRLFEMSHSRTVKYVEKNLPGIREMCLHYAPVGRCEDLKRDLVRRAASLVLLEKGADIRDAATFESRACEAERDLPAVANELCKQVGAALAEYHALNRRLKGGVPPQWLVVMSEVREQMDHLIGRDFVTATPRSRLAHLPRYLKAIRLRLDKLERDPARDRRLAAQVAPHRERCKARLEALSPGEAPDPAFERYRWLVEEFRVSLFAQELGTAEKVSEKRLEAAWKEV